MSQTVYLNGEFLPLDEAKIPVMDRGFLFGDGVYEVIPVYARRPFRLREHLWRLRHSLDGLRLPNPMTDEDWSTLIERLIALQPFEDQWIYLQVTRGVGPRDQAFPAETRPTVFLMGNPLTTPSAEQRERGVFAVTAPDNRWLRCDIKSISLVANVLLRQVSVEAHAAETILLREGYLTEGAVSNVFIVKDGLIRTPPKSHLMLPGITYDVVLDICRLHVLPHAVAPIAEDELRAADEVWITSSSKEVLPVVALDGRPVGKGVPGEVYRRVYGYYQDFKQHEMYRRP